MNVFSRCSVKETCEIVMLRSHWFYFAIHVSDALDQKWRKKKENFKLFSEKEVFKVNFLFVLKNYLTLFLIEIKNAKESEVSSFTSLRAKPNVVVSFRAV